MHIKHPEIKEEMRNLKVGIFIPILNAEDDLERLLPRLIDLDPAPSDVLFVDSSSDDGSPQKVLDAGFRLHTIKRSEFGHGRTRNLALSMMDCDVVLYLTQDAIPVDVKLIEKIILPFQDPKVAHVFARQLAHDDATISAEFSRAFNLSLIHI